MKLLALDGNSIINRAFYGIRILTNKDGVCTNAVMGFLNILLKLTEECKPDRIAAAFDLPAPTFRHLQYKDYKAGRKPMPPELAQQLPLVKDVLRAMGVKVLEQEGFEADDILGTLARLTHEQGGECVIATGDRDSLQLVGDGVQVLLAATKMGRPEVRVYDEAAVREQYGVSPAQLIEVKALQGDTSDHIPGIAGIGPKTAQDLVARFGNLDHLYENLETADLRETLRQKLRQGKGDAYMSRELGRICQQVPLNLDLQTGLDCPKDEDALRSILSRLELFRLLKHMNLSPDAVSTVATESSASELETMAGTNAASLLQQVGEGDLLWSESGVALTVNGRHIWVDETPQALLCVPAKVRTHDAKALYKIGGDALQLQVTFDSMLAAYVVNPDANDYSLQRLCMEYADVTAATPQQQILPFDTVCGKLNQSMTENGQESLFCDIELPLAAVLSEMETVGFLVDGHGIEEYGKTLTQRIEELQSKIYEIIGYSFNLNSPKQLGEALFVKLGLPHGKKTKTGYSTNAEVLEGLRYESEAVALLLEYRQLAKLKSTYCEGLLKEIEGDGRIHSKLNQTETRTGRISSSEPNLQNIPVRTEVGRELRRFFIAPSGCVLVDADYSQIELRVLAHMADDRNMIEAFRSGADIHTATAAQVFGVPRDEVTPLMRSRAKAVNFGIVYGISAFSLSKDIGVSRYEADQYIKEYLSTYYGVDAYMTRVVEEAKKTGYVTTLFGRRRYLPELQASHFNTRAFGERVARNMPVQGTAADIIKIAMIRVSRRLKQERLKARLILQIHDELIVEAPVEEASLVAGILREEMEGAVSLSVPMQVEVHWGNSWYESK